MNTTIYKVTCANCPAVFESVRHNAKYCSETCRYQHRRKRSTTTVVCQACGEDFTCLIFEKASRKYCSRRCAVITNNRLHPKRVRSYPKESITCPECDGPKSYNARHCVNCYKDKMAEERVTRWLEGTWTGGGIKHEYILSDTIRNYLLKQSNYACSKCGFNMNHPVDGLSVLEVNHIDGNPYNHRPKNLEVLCPNCHALTPNYRGRNSGKGRPYRYKYKN